VSFWYIHTIVSKTSADYQYGAVPSLAQSIACHLQHKGTEKRV